MMRPRRPRLALAHPRRPGRAPAAHVRQAHQFKPPPAAAGPRLPVSPPRHRIRNGGRRRRLHELLRARQQGLPPPARPAAAAAGQDPRGWVEISGRGESASGTHRPCPCQSLSLQFNTPPAISWWVTLSNCSSPARPPKKQTTRPHLCGLHAAELVLPVLDVPGWAPRGRPVPCPAPPRAASRPSKPLQNPKH